MVEVHCDGGGQSRKASPLSSLAALASGGRTILQTPPTQHQQQEAMMAAGIGSGEGIWHEASAADGTHLAYRLHQGQGLGRIALVHALAMDAGFWDEVVPLLLPFASVITIDCRGHGRSDKPAGPYSIEQFGDDLAAVLDAAGWQRAVVAGASMGGCVALAFAARHGARVAGLGLFDTTAWYGEKAPEQWAERADKAQNEGMASLIGFQKSRWVSAQFLAANPPSLQRALDVFVANDVTAYGHTCRMLGAADLRSALPGFAFPTRILVGEEDFATPPAMAEALHQAIAGSTLRILPGARHFSPLEVPTDIAAELEALVSQASAD
jgi:3-oxoadipate enol-lactonase